MSDVSTDTVKEIEHTRHRLQDELRILHDRMPSPGEIGKKAALVAGAAGGVIVVTMIVRRVARAREPEPAMPAAVRAVVEKLPEPVAERVTAVDLDQVKKVLGVAVMAVTLAARITEFRRARRDSD